MSHSEEIGPSGTNANNGKNNEKHHTEFSDQIEMNDEPYANKPQPGLQPPELVARMTPEQRTKTEAALTRKIDIRLLPMIILMYILNYLDRNNIATARLSGNPGMQEDLNMDDQQWQTAVSILFVGYILMQIPSNLFLNKFGKPAIYLPSIMIVWGAISTATAAASSYGGLVAIRFCLGFVEAAYFPGCLFYLSCWWAYSVLKANTAC